MTSKHLKLAALAIGALAAIGQAQANEYLTGKEALVVSTGNPANWVLQPGNGAGAVDGALDGVARLLFTTQAGQNYICSGSLLAGGTHVLTAAHCADDFKSMTIDFKQGAVKRNASQAFVHSAWTGALGNGSDIAVIKLDQAVTDIQGFALSGGNDFKKDFLMAGYGLVGTGNTGSTGFDWGKAHYGYNTIDIVDTLQYGYEYINDFDNGTAAKNSIARLGAAWGTDWTSGTGLGAGLESQISNGDSGGGDFVFDAENNRWLLTGVHSWGWGDCNRSLGVTDCDASAPAPDANDWVRPNSSFGDLSGSTAVFSHVDWINAVTAVPEPSSYALMALGLFAVGAVARRRKA